MPTKTFDASWGSAPGYVKEPMLSSSQLEQLAELLGRPRAEIERAIAETLKTLWLFKYTTPPLEGSQRAALGQLAKKADWLRRKLKELDPAALRKLLTEYEGGPRDDWAADIPCEQIILKRSDARFQYDSVLNDLSRLCENLTVAFKRTKGPGRPRNDWDKLVKERLSRAYGAITIDAPANPKGQRLFVSVATKMINGLMERELENQENPPHKTG